MSDLHRETLLVKGGLLSDLLVKEQQIHYSQKFKVKYEVRGGGGVSSPSYYMKPWMLVRSYVGAKITFDTTINFKLRLQVFFSYHIISFIIDLYSSFQIKIT